MKIAIFFLFFIDKLKLNEPGTRVVRSDKLRHQLKVTHDVYITFTWITSACALLNKSFTCIGSPPWTIFLGSLVNLMILWSKKFLFQGPVIHAAFSDLQLTSPTIQLQVEKRCCGYYQLCCKLRQPRYGRSFYISIGSINLSWRRLKTGSAVLSCRSQACWLKRNLWRGLLFFNKFMYRRIFFIFSLLNDCIVNLPEKKRKFLFLWQFKFCLC